MLVEALALDKDKETVSTKSALSVYHMGALGALGGFGGLPRLPDSVSGEDWEEEKRGGGVVLGGWYGW